MEIIEMLKIVAIFLESNKHINAYSETIRIGKTKFKVIIERMK